MSRCHRSSCKELVSIQRAADSLAGGPMMKPGYMMAWTVRAVVTDLIHEAGHLHRHLKTKGCGAFEFCNLAALLKKSNSWLTLCMAKLNVILGNMRRPSKFSQILFKDNMQQAHQMNSVSQFLMSANFETEAVPASCWHDVAWGKTGRPQKQKIRSFRTMSCDAQFT